MTPLQRALFIIENAQAKVIAEDPMAPWKQERDGQRLPLPILQGAKWYLTTQKWQVSL